MGERCQRFVAWARFGERARWLMLLSLVSLFSFSRQGLGVEGDSTTPAFRPTGTPKESVALYTRLPLSFEVNRGQTDRRVKFLAHGHGYTLFLTSNEAVLVLREPSAAGNSKFEIRNSKFETGNWKLDGRIPNPESRIPALLRLKLVGADPSAQVVGEEELPGQSNYFLGKDPGRWRTHIPTYARVRYRSLYPGVDLVYYGHQGQLENDFEVAPGVDPSRISLRIEGAEGMKVDAEGDLVLEVGGGEVRLHRPLAYQPSEGGKRWVTARYVLHSGNRVGWEVKDYDRRSLLVIDPVLSYSTYLGGTGGDVAYGIAVDSAGNAYVTGSTASSNFPVRSAEQSTNAGGGDAFVAKLNPSGSGLIYSTYLGGNGADSGEGIFVDTSGNAYVVGNTYSTSFPVTSNAFQSDYGGNGDAFVAKLNSTGSVLTYASYLGGSAADFGQGITVDSSGNAYVTGSTLSADFPTVNPLQISNDGCSVVVLNNVNVVSCSSDVFVAKVNPSGTALVYSTYLGGSSADYGQAIVVDGSGNAYVAGYTFSTDFPTQSAWQSSNAGGADAFLTELNAAGSALTFSTYLGGSGQDRAYGLALDSAGSLYLTGDTQSSNFPLTSGAFQTSNMGQGDAFVCKLSSGASTLVYSTLLGGSGVDQATSIARDSSGNVYITGYTQSSDFPTANRLQTLLGGISGAGSCGSSLCADAFVSMFGPSGALVYSTYLGGSGADLGNAIAVDFSGAAYVAGSTASANFPAIAGASQGSYAGTSSGSNAFVTKVANLNAPGVALIPQQVNFGNQTLNNTSDARAVTLINAGSAALDITSIVAGGDFAETDNCGTVVPGGGGSCTIQVTFTPTTTGTSTDAITITDNAQGSPHLITVTGTGVRAAGSLTITPTSLTFPPETVGVTSPAQVVRLANTGLASVTLTAISISAEFAQTNTCGGVPNNVYVLNVGDSCTVSITFTPTGSGNRTGSLTITDDAAGSPQTVTLSGSGNPVFSLSGNPRSQLIIIGKSYTTFTVSASAPSSFIDSISLACSSAATCSFNPSSITGGQSSTVTVTGLAATGSNPLNFTVNGTSGSQTASVALTIFFMDFSLTTKESLNSVTAGNSVTYTIIVTPSHRFNEVVLLSCANLPQDAGCTWYPPGVTLNGTTEATAYVKVTTTSQSRTLWRGPPTGNLRFSPTTGWQFMLLWLAAFALLAASVGTRRGLGSLPQGARPRLRLAALAMLLALFAFGAGCETYSQYPRITTATVSGTPTGNYTITIVGTLGSDNSVTRTTTTILSVGPG